MKLFIFTRNNSIMDRFLQICLAAIIICMPLKNAYASMAGIVNPENGKIFSLKYHASYFNNENYHFNGWSNTGQIDWIKLYINGYYKGSVDGANEGSWYLEKKFDPGVNEIYIVTRCNYSGCSRDGEQSSSIFVTYIPTPETGDFRVSTGDYQDKIKIYSYLTLNGVTTYYRVWRCDENKINGIGWKSINGWQTSKEIVDQNVEPGKEYYYFLQISSKSTGAYDSEYSPGQVGYTEEPYTYCYDGDKDGYGDDKDTKKAFSAPEGYVLNCSDQCPLDGNKYIPGNCGCGVDESNYKTYYLDTDGDGFGDLDTPKQSCTQPDKYVLDSSDKCPSDINKKVPGLCDCNIDDSNFKTYYADTDGDGFGDLNTPKQSCSQPDKYVLDSSDKCTSDQNLKEPVTWYYDSDDDGSGDINNQKTECTQPIDYVSNNKDQCPFDSDIVSIKLSVKETFGSPGTSISIPVYLSDVCNDGFSIDSFGFSVLFNDDILNFTSLDKTNTLVENFTLVEGVVIENGKVKINGALFGQPMHIDKDGVFLKLNFSVNTSATVDSTIELTDLKNDIQNMQTTPSQFLLKYKVTINTAGNGSVNNEIVYLKPEETIEIKAIPAENSDFVGWSGDISNLNQTITLENISSDKLITANFDIKTFNITINKQGEGTVSQESTVVQYGDNLEIIASPETSSNFINWTGDISDSKPTIVIENITSDKSITANFELKTFTVTINTQGEGTVSQESTVVQYGDNLEITAKPAISSNFIGWSEALSDTNPTIVIENITSNKSITANFEFKTFNITINTQGKGTVSQESTVVQYGDNLEIIASPETSSNFINWTGDISDSKPTIVIENITSDKSITANFELKTFTVTINKTGEGTVSKETQTVQYGDDLEITAMPENGFIFKGWSGDYSYTNSTIILKNIIADQSMTANFVQNTFTKLTFPSEIKIIPGSTINVPVYLEYNPSDNEIRGIDIILLEKNDFLELIDVNLSDGILSAYEKNVNTDLKDIAVYISNSEKITGSGKLMDVIFKVNNKISEPILTSTLEFAEAFFNEDKIPHNHCKLVVNQIFQTDIAFMIEEDQVLTGNVLDYINDSVNQSLSFIIVEQSSKGTAQLTNQSGGFLYTPFINQFGQDSFVISVTDGNFDPITTTVLLSISPLDDPPTITNLTDQKGNMNIPLTVLFAINDLDTPVENLHLSVSSSNENLIESIKLSGTDNNRSIVIQPAFGQIGNTTISIELSDETNTIQKDFNLSIRDIELGFIDETCMICAPGETVSISLNLINTEIPTIKDIHLSIAYDPGVLSPLGMTFTGAFFETDPYTHTCDLQLDEGSMDVNIQLNSSVNNGVLGNLFFTVYGTAIVGESTSVVINNATINEQKITANAGCVALTGFTINGVVYHFNGKPVPDTRVDLIGKKSYHTLTDESGTYTLVGLPEDFYSISYSKIDNSKIGLAAYDISLIGQYITQLIELGCYEKIASDGSQNGDILSYDAGSLALYVAELQTGLNNTNTHWTFVTQPINRCDWTHDNLIDYQSTEIIHLTENMNFSITAVKLGDVTGNWAPPSEGQIRKRCATRKSYGKIEVLRNAHFNVPVTLTEYTNVAGINLKIKYDAEILNFSGASLDDSVLESGEYRMMINQTVPGQLIVLLYSNLGSSLVSGSVVNLSFDSIKSGSGMINIEELICDEIDAIGGLEPKGLDKSYPVQHLMVTVKNQMIQIR